jgi:DnaK suppressor protein
MTRDELLRLRDQAGAQVSSLQGELQALFEASRASNADDEHDPEGTTIAFERAQLTAVLDAARRHLRDLDLAVHHFDEGTYGVCETCGKEIPDDRMTARPSARTCITCASAQRR